MTSRGTIPKAQMLVGAMLASLLVPLACDSPPSRSADNVEPAPSSPAPQAAAPKMAAKSEAEPLELKDEDFVENESNRDPFRTYLSEFLTPQRRTAKIQRKVLLPRYGLDELQLIAVVAGRVRPVAMFRDPTGLGVTVKRGDYISKSSGKVKQILPDRVVVQIEEKTDRGQSMADRVISLHPKTDGRTRRR